MVHIVLMIMVHRTTAQKNMLGQLQSCSSEAYIWINLVVTKKSLIAYILIYELASIILIYELASIIV